MAIVAYIDSISANTLLVGTYLMCFLARRKGIMVGGRLEAVPCFSEFRWCSWMFIFNTVCRYKIWTCHV